MNIESIIAENVRLREKVKVLEAEVVALKKLAFLERQRTISKGIRGESLVASWVNGVVTTHNASHDINIDGQNVRIEVKYSGLNSAVRGRTPPTLRWAWAKPFGESGNKVYDRLILVGDIDPIHASKYKDPACPYVLFDIPYEDVMPLTIQTLRYRSIQLTTNPDTARSAASLLFRRYQVTIADLSEQYGL